MIVIPVRCCTVGYIFLFSEQMDSSISHALTFSFSVGKRIFKDQCSHHLLFGSCVSCSSFKLHGVNMFRTSWNLVRVLGLFCGMSFVFLVLLLLSLWHFFILSSFSTCSIWNRKISKRKINSFPVETPLSKVGMNFDKLNGSWVAQAVTWKWV